ncbi:MAG: hypothetical protein ACLSGS_03325 [Adlercreutzia sp.]
MRCADIDIGAFLNDILMLTRSCKVTLPSSITSVSRGIVTLEGTIAPFIPNQNVVSIINAHIQRSKNQGDELVQAMQDLALALRSSSHGALDAARYSGETLKMLTRGQLKMNMEVLGSEAPLSKLAKIINRLTIGIIIAGLFIGSSMLSLSSMEPRLLECAGARVLRLPGGGRAVGMGGLRHQQAQAVAPGSFSFPSSNVPQPIIAENSN